MQRSHNDVGLQSSGSDVRLVVEEDRSKQTVDSKGNNCLFQTTMPLRINSRLFTNASVLSVKAGPDDC